MITYDTQYKNILKRILDEGQEMKDRTGVGVRKVFDVNISQKIDQKAPDTFSLPILALRKVFPRTAWKELFWMLSGSTDARILQKDKIHIWDGNSSREFLDNRGLDHIREGFIGKGYGKQFRDFGGVDQLMTVVGSLLKDPTGRRHFISLWNPVDEPEMALPPCHVSYHFVPVGDTLNLKFYQRSSDFVLAGNTNFLFASFFLIWMSQLTRYKVGTVSQSIGDCHIYNNHLEVAQELVERDIPENSESCMVFDFSDAFNGALESTDLFVDTCIDRCYHSWEDVVIVDYNPQPKIEKERLVMAV